jgi:hypothetical protein
MNDVINNNSDSIKEWLLLFYKEVKEVKHLGNFVFEAVTNLGTIKILATPMNEDQTKIKVVRAL